MFSSLSSLAFLLTLVQLSQSACVHFKIDLTWEKYAPDGFSRSVILSNGQFPGPPLYLDYGDDVEFVVNNYLPFETAVHFHGIEQLDTPWSDGVPGLAQKLIPAGGSFNYRWTATQYGTYWYHGHAAGQIQDGLYGAIIIRPHRNQPSPLASISSNYTDLKALQKAEAHPKIAIISDWEHLTSDEYAAAEAASGLDLYCVDSLLVNGKGAVNCQPQALLDELTFPPLKKLLNGTTVSDKGCTPATQKALTQGNFTTNPSKLPPGVNSGCVPTNGSTEIITVNAKDGWASINFIGAMSLKTPVVSIDNHPMYVYAVDGQYITPQPADSIFMYSGERYAAFIKLDQPPGDYTIRVGNQNADQLISGYATLRYKGGAKNVTSTPFINYAGMNVSTSVVPLDETALVPYLLPPPATTADATYKLYLGRYGANWVWSLSGNQSYNFQDDNAAPLLYYPNSASAHDPRHSIRTQNNTWVDIILQVVLGPQAMAQPAHPIHKHGNKAYQIGSGTGTFNYSSVAEAMKYIPQSFNLKTPQFKDSFATPAVLKTPAWVAFRYQVNNPGAWALHCHTQTHIGGGMAVVLMDGVDAWPQIPSEYALQ